MVLFLYLACVFSLYFIRINNVPLIYRTCEGLNLKGGNTYQKFADFNAEQEYDIIVLGSSHAYRGYDPAIFGKNGIDLFNLGTSAQTMVNSYFIAKNYIHIHSCKMVILDVFDGALIADEFESTSDLIANVSSEQTAIELSLHLKDPRSINMLAVRWLNSGRNAYYTDTNYRKNGYTTNSDSVKGKLNYEFYGNKIISETQLFYLGKTMQYLKDQKIPFILINHPLPSFWDMKGHKSYSEKISELAVKHKVKFYDYAELPITHPLYDYYDAHHLNQNGVNVFNNYILQHVSELERMIK